MKRITKKIRLTHRRTLIVPVDRNSIQIPCRECPEQAWMLLAEKASGLTGVGIRTIYRHVEAGRVHFQETADGFLMICISSLLSIETPGGGNDLTF